MTDINRTVQVTTTINSSVDTGLAQVTITDANNPLSPIIQSGGAYTCLSSGVADMTANFTVDDDEPTIGQIVTFTDTTDESPTEFGWDFGDGDTSSTQNPTHIYTETGTFTVTLSASNVGNQGDTVIKTNLITVSALPLNSGIVLRLDENSTVDANNKMSQWDDDSGQDDHAIQLTAANQPLKIDSYNGVGTAVQYDPTASFAHLESTHQLTPPFTVFIVCQTTNLSGNAYVFGFTGGFSFLIRNFHDGSDEFAGGFVRIEAFAIISPTALNGAILKYGLKLITVSVDVPSTVNGLKLYIDGVLDVQDDTTVNTMTAANTGIGGFSNASTATRGRDLIQQVLVHNTVLTGADLAAYNNFFIEKFNIQ